MAAKAPPAPPGFAGWPEEAQGPGRPPVWRGDLLRLRARHGADALYRSAALLGFQAPEPEPQDEPALGEEAPAAPPRGERADAAPSRPRAAISKQRYPRLLRRDPVPESERVTQAPARLARTPVLDPAEIGPDPDYRPPRPPPLAPWRRLWPFLRLALGTRRFSHRIDLPRLVERLARGETPRRLPRLARQGWAPAAQLLVDLDLRLYPFWQDFLDLVEGLSRLRGRAGLELLCLADGPEGGAHPWAGRRADAAPYRLPESGTPLLILSDLGYLDGRQAPWLGLGRRLKAAGVRPVALMPCPPRYWDAELVELYYPMVWDRGRRFPRHLGRVRPEQPGREPDLAPLLRLIACAVRVEPALLRAIRMRLPAAVADVGSEAAVWRHPDVRNDGLTCVLRPEAQEAWRDAAALERDQPLDAEAKELLRAHHRGLSPAIAAEEEMIRAQSSEGIPDSSALELMWRVAATLDRPTDYPHLQRLQAWVLRMAERQHQALWCWEQADPMAIALAKVLVQQFGDPGADDLPAGFDPNRVLWVFQQAVPKEYELRLEVDRQGEQCLVLKSQAVRIARLPENTETRQEPGWVSPGVPRVARPTEIPREPGVFPPASEGTNMRVARLEERRWVQKSHVAPYSVEIPFAPGDILVARLTLGSDWLRWRHLDPEGEPGRMQFTDIRRDREIPLPPSGSLQVLGSHESLEIDALERPHWAWITQGRGPAGEELFHLTPVDRPGQRLRWLPAGDHPVRDQNGRSLGEYKIHDGCFLDEAQYLEIAGQGFVQPPWADAVGTDAYGLYADFSYRGVVQRFRWIPPGRFRMGSPEGEAERDSDETLHEVILSRGYWLADTACTQEMWRAVMAGNPSHFKGEGRPVEQVSWEDVGGFLDRLNREVPGLELRLPTEAEWEYACRAGSETPFWFGDNITPEQVNYHGNYPYAGGKKGLYRKKTVEVKALPSNAWGLYQMHGNLWEWCGDWFGDYPAGPVTDPEGPETGVRRVLRGGSWIFHARNCRSAYRFPREPGYRGHYAGFRLARGRTGGKQGKAGK